MAPTRSIRKDLDGVVTVHVAGVATTLHAGDPVPRGVELDDELLEGAGTDDDPTPASTIAPLSDTDRAKAEGLGLPVDDDELSADYTRGYLAGYGDGSDVAVQTKVSEGAADDGGEAGPDDKGVTVHGEPGPSGPSTPPTGEVTTPAYDPAADNADGSTRSVRDVNDYIAAHPEQRDAILAAEESGKRRAGILNGPHAGN